MDREDLNRKVDLAFLSAFYGGMLTGAGSFPFTVRKTFPSPRLPKRSGFHARLCMSP